MRYFVTVAEELNFSRAAARLRVSQPPLSRQIKSLEEEIGTELFDRSKRNLQLTPAGKSFLDQAKQILEQSGRAARLAKAVGQGKSGHLTVAFLSPLGGTFLPVALRTFRQRFPSVEVTITEMVPGQQVKALLESRIDVGFLARCEVRFENELALEALGDIGWVAALPPEHALARLRKVPLRKLANEKLVSFDRSSAPATHDWIRDLCRANGFEPTIVRQCFQSHAILDSVAGGLGVAILPELFRRYQGEVVFRPLAPSTPKIELCMAWRRSDASEALRELRAIMRQAFREKSRKHSTTEF